MYGDNQGFGGGFGGDGFGNGGYGGYGNDSERISDRDMLERDEYGRIRHEVQEEKRRQQGSGGGGGGGREPGGWKRILATVSAIALLVFLLLGISGKDGKGFLRSWSMTNEQGLAEMFNSVQEMEDMNKRVGEERTSLDTNRLYHDSYMEEMVAKEYLVYVYTGDESLDKDFTKWVEENEDDVVIFRIEADIIETNLEVKSYLEEEGKNVPMMLIYNEVARGEKKLEGVVKDAKLLDEAKKYIDKLIEEKEQN